VAVAIAVAAAGDGPPPRRAACLGIATGPGKPVTVRSCLHVILSEEWEHLRYAVRDLDAIEAEHAG
jgi:hypothetical protein